jgi:hypothetical protein
LLVVSILQRLNRFLQAWSSFSDAVAAQWAIQLIGAILDVIQINHTATQPLHHTFVSMQDLD